MNILGFNIGQNYKGILNLGSTINTPLSATLQSVTDGMGVASPLQLSTTQVGFEQSSAGYINRWYNSGGTANARKYAVYVANNYWSLTTRNDAEDSGEQFIIATALGGNLSRLELGKSVSPLILSTSLATLASSNLAVGHTTASARLHVRGDGTNSVARFESSAGTTGLFINQNADYLGLIGNTNTGFQFNSNSIDLYTNNAAGSNQGYFRVFGRNSTAINGTTYGVDLGGISLGSTTGFGFTAGAGIANFRPLNLTYTINNSGAQTGTATGIFLNATETALNGMTHNLLDLQVGGVSRFRVANTGVLTLGQAGTYFITLSSQGINFSGGTQQIIVDSNLLLRQQTAGTFGLLQFAGTTNAFPALKRNGAALEVRLADDSAFANLAAANITGTSLQFTGIIQDSNNGTNIDFPSNGVITLFNNGSTDFDRLQFGGTSASFPALRRNGAALEVVLANATAGSGFAALFASSVRTPLVQSNSGANNGRVAVQTWNNMILNVEDGGVCIESGVYASPNASAILQANSTTKGFLLPRMTEAQRLAIAGGTPAIGLMVYQTDGTDGLYVYKAGGWQFIA